MKNNAKASKAFTALIKRLSKSTPQIPEAGSLPPTEYLVRAFLSYDVSTTEADAAYDRMMAEMVDFNDLRVTDTSMIVASLGDAYLDAYDRAKLMRQTLNAIYEKEHGVDLISLNELGKREGKKYLDSIDEMPDFVRSSLLLLFQNARAMPVDQLLVKALKHEGVLADDEEVTLSKLETFITGQVKAPELYTTYFLLRQCIEDTGVSLSDTPARKSSKASKKKTAKKKTTKKTTKKTAKKKTAKKTTKKAAKKKTKKK